jgi:hypothetical protein
LIQRLNERRECEAKFIVIEVFVDPLRRLCPYPYLSQRGSEVALSRGPFFEAWVWLAHDSSA